MSHHKLDKGYGFLRRNLEESYKCRLCGSETKLSDFHYQEAGLYYSLKDTGMCEQCLKQHFSCFGCMDMYIVTNCGRCTEGERDACFKATFGEFLKDEPP